MGNVVIRLHNDKAATVLDLSRRSGLSVPVLVDRMLLSFIEHQPGWLIQLIDDHGIQVAEECD